MTVLADPPQVSIGVRLRAGVYLRDCPWMPNLCQAAPRRHGEGAAMRGSQRRLGAKLPREHVLESAVSHRLLTFTMLNL